MKSIALISLLLVAGTAQAADEYVCKVYCNSGTTQVGVRASSRDEAAAIVDRMPDQVCKGEGKGNKSSSTMRAEQCSRR